jgi:hypothetical protein
MGYQCRGIRLNKKKIKWLRSHLLNESSQFIHHETDKLVPRTMVVWKLIAPITLASLSRIVQADICKCVSEL